MEKLLPFGFADVQSAFRGLAREPRAEFQTAYPDLGTVIRRTEAVRAERLRLERNMVPFVLCDRIHTGYLTFVDADGEPCDPHESPERKMAMCRCRREWLAKAVPNSC